MATAIRVSDYFKPTDQQKLFFEAIRSHTYTLYGGAAGGGKSRALRWACLVFLLDCAAKGLKNVQVGIFCETFPSLKDRQIKPFLIEVPDWLGTFNKTDSEFWLKPEFGGGVLMFRNLDNSAKYQSVEFAAIAVDELTKNPEQTFYDLISRLRWSGIDEVRFFAATNPGSIGHAWVKKLWIDRNFQGTGHRPDDFCFIQAKATDNPFLSKAYLQTLASLPEAMRRALLDGSWDLFEGQFFSEFGTEHIIDPILIRPEWERGVAVDYGFRDPWCALWMAKDPSNGRTYIYRELYEKNVPDREQAQRILLEGANENRSWAVGDPAMFGKKGADEGSVAEAYSAAGLILLPANNERIGGWQEVRRMLMPLADGKPGLQVFKNCENVIRTFPEMVYDPRKGGEDLNTRLEDHAIDCVRYGLQAFRAFNDTAIFDKPREHRSKKQFSRTWTW